MREITVEFTRDVTGYPDAGTVATVEETEAVAALIGHGYAIEVTTNEPLPLTPLDLEGNETIEQVMTYVNGDPTRAQEAYNLEAAKAKPRVTLLDELLAAGATAPVDA